MAHKRKMKISGQDEKDEEQREKETFSRVWGCKMVSHMDSTQRERAVCAGSDPIEGPARHHWQPRASHSQSLWGCQE